MSATTANVAALAAAAFRHGFGGVLRVVPGEGEPFDVDGRSGTCRVGPAAPGLEPDCVWRASADTLSRIFEGGRALESAYLSGRLSIAGDMSVMARLALENPR